MAAKTVAIVQSNYIPWKGYFDLINMVDEFILYDDIQYTRRDWRNRNLIKTPDGLRWLTIPVEVKGKYLQKIHETRISDPAWGKKHWATLAHNYAKTKWFRKYTPILKPLYLEAKEESLSRVNLLFIQSICQILGIGTKLSWSMDYSVREEDKTQRLVALCKAAGATHYISGPSAQVYLDEAAFAKVGIGISYMDYSGYPAYDQLYGEFEHRVTILDLLFSAGDNAPLYMKSFS